MTILPLVLLTIFFLVLLGLTYYREPRTLLLGIYFVLALLFLGATLFYLANQFDLRILKFLLSLAIFLVILPLLAGPSILIITLLVKGIQLIKREGHALKNLLSLGIGLSLLAFPYLFQMIASHYKENSLVTGLLSLVTTMVIYLILLISAYTISSFLNLIHWFKRPIDYVLVLGSGLMGDKVTPLLASRIKKGIEIYQKHPDCRLILSGGQGKDELIAEGQAMAKYALSQGVPEKDIIIEDRSKNTRENLQFSSHLMANKANLAIVTNYYHLFRALLIARDLGIPCIGYGAKTKFYFSLNAYIREFIGYLYFKRHLHGGVLLFIVALHLVLIGWSLLR